MQGCVVSWDMKDGCFSDGLVMTERCHNSCTVSAGM